MNKKSLYLLVVLVLVLQACSLSSGGGASTSSGQESDVIFQDDFSDPDSGWPLFEESNYESGHYFLINSDPGVVLSGVNNADTYEDLVFEAETTQVSAPANNNNGYGIGCRTQDNGDGYQFFISGDGFYAITMQEDQAITPLVDWSESDVILQGNTTNTLKATCNGTLLQFEVNGQLLAETYDSKYDTGYISLLALSFEDESTEIHYDDVVVRRPSGEPSSSPGTSSAQTGAILFEDDFSDPNSGWTEFAIEGNNVAYMNGAYAIISAVDIPVSGVNPAVDYADVVIGVEATQISGPANNNNAYGVGCRLQEDAGYDFFISGDGFYAIVRYESPDFIPLVDWTASSAIRQGNSTNLIRVTCSGTLLRLEVNGQLLEEVYDDAIDSGAIELLAVTYESEPTEIHFDNLVVREP